jgi:hypothetical protein
MQIRFSNFQRKELYRLYDINRTKIYQKLNELNNENIGKWHIFKENNYNLVVGPFIIVNNSLLRYIFNHRFRVKISRKIVIYAIYAIGYLGEIHRTFKPRRRDSR